MTKVLRPPPPSVQEWLATPAHCRQSCPVCARRCLGGPARYTDRHLCPDMHQWGQPRDPVAEVPANVPADTIERRTGHPAQTVS